MLEALLVDTGNRFPGPAVMGMVTVDICAFCGDDTITSDCAASVLPGDIPPAAAGCPTPVAA